MKIYFDNIIFSLQKAGGISVVWTELIKRALKDPKLNLYFLDERNENIFRNQLTIPEESIIDNPLSKIPISFQRYMNPNKLRGKGVFHSSYYRTTSYTNFANITTVHDFTYEYFKKGLPKFVHHKQKGNAINKSKKTICISESTKNDLLNFFPNYPESQISVIYNGVSEEYSKIPNKVQAQLNRIIPFDTEGYFLYVGDRSSQYKNFNLVIETSKVMKLPIVLAGGGELTKNEKRFLDSAIGTGSYKAIIGLSNNDLNLLYNHALCLIYPSLYEGFGIPIVEAQKAGCPVICSNSSSIPEIAGEGAYVIKDISKEKLIERLLQLLNSSGERKRLTGLGLQNADRFSWDNCYQQTKQVYHEVYEKYF